MAAPALTEANLKSLIASAKTNTFSIPVITVPYRAHVRDKAATIKPQWVRMKDGIKIELTMDALTESDANGKLVQRSWISLVNRELSPAYGLKDHSAVRLLDYQSLRSEVARDDPDRPLSFEGSHARFYHGWFGAAKPVTTVSVWKTFYQHGNETLKFSEPKSWFLIVERLNHPIRERPVFRQPPDFVWSDSELESDEEESVDEDDDNAEEGESVGKRLLKKTKQWSAAEFKGFQDWLNMAEQHAYLIHGGEARTGEPDKLDWNTLPLKEFYEIPEFNHSITQPLVSTSETLHSKARFVAKISPQLTPAEIAALKGKRAGNGSAFLISDEYMVTAFHCLMKPEKNVRGGYKWYPLTTSLKFLCVFPIIGLSFEVGLNVDGRVAYSSPDMHLESRGAVKFVRSLNIENDIVIFKLPTKVTEAIRALHIPAADFIQLKEFDKKNNNDALLLQPESLKSEVLQTIYIFGFPMEARNDAPGGPPQVCVTTRDNYIRHHFHWELCYSAPTWGGMSGGPGLLADGTLICMHRRCGPKFGGRKPGGAPSSSLNFGLRLDLFLHDQLPSKYMKDPRAKTLRDIVRSVQHFYTQRDDGARGSSAAMSDGEPASTHRQQASSAAAAAAAPVRSTAIAAAPTHPLMQIAETLLNDPASHEYLRNKLQSQLR